MQSKVKMIFLKILVTLALWQVVKLQEEGKMNVSTLSTGGQCVSREEFEQVRAETETLKHELNSWQNTTISILKTYLLDQGVGQCACTTDIKQLWEKMDRVQDTVAANNASTQENVTLQQQLLQYMQSLEQRILEQNKTLQEMARYFSIQHFANGTFQNPAPSCKYIEQGSPSGYYWIQRPTTGYASQVYCDMTRRCNGTGGWMRIVDLDMTNPSHRCPQGFRTITSPKRLCGKSRDDPGCVSVTFDTHRVRYQKVCGRVIGYQHFNTDAFRPYHDHRSRTIDDQYLDGVSLTHGSSPRKHIWSFAAANDETSSREWVCPCTRTDRQFLGVVPPFVGQDYFCETGSRYLRQNRTYTHDPLWDGRGCGATSTCCSFNSPPWFCKQLPQPTIDNIELRLCSEEPIGNDDTPLEVIELYIQ